MDDIRERYTVKTYPLGFELNDILYRGYGFKVEFTLGFLKTGTLDVFLFQSYDTDEGYLRMTGPGGFEFGHKWRSTQVVDLTALRSIRCPM